MKTHLFHFLLLVTVLGCLVITLRQSSPESQPLPQLQQAFVPVQPSPSPHPIDAYRQQRTAARREMLSALETLLQSGSEAIRSQAEAETLSLQKAVETELMVEGMLAGIGHEMAVCAVQGNALYIFTTAALSNEEADRVLQTAAEWSQINRENIRLMVP